MAAGVEDNLVLTRGLGFLRRSMRPDGSWPIDTNLATWLTTLSVNALQDRLSERGREPTAAWLVGQQYREVHPFTGRHQEAGRGPTFPAAFRVPTTRRGRWSRCTRLVRGALVMDAVTRGVRWLLGLQNRDGGIPTFCRGWGTLPFDCSSADITAHALLAWAVWHPSLAGTDQRRVDGAVIRAVAFLEKTQRADGAWTPLWFGNESAPREENPVYGTARVLLGLGRAAPGSTAIPCAVNWLLASQNADGGWGGDRGVRSTIEETSLGVAALASRSEPGASHAVRRGVACLVTATHRGEDTLPSPIGLYFARLRYHEATYPLIFAVDALQRAEAAGLVSSGARPTHVETARYPGLVGSLD